MANDARHVCPWLVGRLLAHLNPMTALERDFGIRLTDRQRQAIAAGNVMPLPTIRLTPAQRALMSMGPGRIVVVPPTIRHGRRAAMAQLASLAIPHMAPFGVCNGVPYGYQ